MSEQKNINVEMNDSLNDSKPFVKPLVDRADHRMDVKRRFSLPISWYERMGAPQQLYTMISLSGQNCIDVFTPEEFDKKFKPLREKALSNENAANFVSRLGELVSVVSIDSAKRLRIKEQYLSYIGIGLADENIVLIGANNKFEIWSLKNRPLERIDRDYVEETRKLAREFDF